MTLFPFLKGCGISAGLIAAIGPQNTFVLRKALKRQNVLLMALLCTLIDACLIILGVAGLGSIITEYPMVLAVAKWGGVLCLFGYAAYSLYSGFYPNDIQIEERDPTTSLTGTVLLLLALGFLNPHAYLDVVLLGSVGAQFSGSDRISFTAGSILVSCLWFFTLSYGAHFLSPYFQSQKAWRVLDFSVAGILFLIGMSLIIG